MSFSRLFCTSLLAISVTTTAVADEDKPQNSKKSTSISVSGKSITINTDGKLDIQSFGDKHDLPEHVQKLLADAMKQVDQGKQRDSETNSLKVHSSGWITIIGPDGKPQTKSINQSTGPLSSTVVELLKKSLGHESQLPKEIQEQLAKTLQKNVDQTAKKSRSKDSKSSTKEEEVLTKLDQILNRLEKLEQEISELKKAN